MFYSDIILAKKGPLANIWLAAHFSKKLSKSQIFDTNIEGSVEAIKNPHVALALRVSGHLLLGVVRVYSRKVKYLYNDVNFARTSLSREYTNTNVDLPIAQSSGSINLAGGFGNFEDDDDSQLIYDAPNVKRWAALAVYQHIADDDEQEDYTDDPYRGTDAQGDEPFTSFGDRRTTGFGADESDFDFDAEPEVGRKRAPEDRQSLGFGSSPVPVADESRDMQDQQDVFAPVDSTMDFGDEGLQNSFGGGDFSVADNDNMFGNESQDASQTAADPAEEEDDGDAQDKSRAQAGQRSVQKFKVKRDEVTTIPRKQLKARSRKAANEQITAVRDRRLQVWDHSTHISAGFPKKQASRDAAFALPGSGIAVPGIRRLFQSSVEGTLRITNTALPSKRGRDSISQTGDDKLDEEEIEVARHRPADESVANDSTYGAGDWSTNFDDNNASYEAPMDDDVHLGGGQPRNQQLEDALMRSQEEEERKSDTPLRSEDTLNARTVAMMRVINQELGVDSQASAKADDDGAGAFKAPEKTVQLDDMISGFRRAPAAAAFFEVLALKSRGFIDVEQNAAFGSIQISSTGTFVDPKPQEAF